MNALSLDDAWAKLRWASKHFDVLRREIESFQQMNDYAVAVDVDRDAGEYVFHISGLKPLDPDWGLRIGDCIHNARTALDYVMVRLVALTTGQNPRDVEAVQFPIYDDPAKFNSAVGELRKNLALSGYLARVHELQPFNNGNLSVWGGQRVTSPNFSMNLPVVSPLPVALDRLSRLDNLDKHRVVHAAWLGVAFESRMDPKAPPDFKLRGSNTFTGPLVNGAEIGKWLFEVPLPGSGNPNRWT